MEEKIASPWEEVSPEQLLQRFHAGDAPLLVDVRTLPEVAAYHIPGILWIPLNDLPRRFGEIDPEREAMLLCEHGIRSVAACQFLQGQGYGRLSNLTGGMCGWDGPVEQGIPPRQR